MMIHMEGTVAYLQGDLTCSGITHCSIDSLVVSLEHLEIGKGKHLRINCERVHTVDIDGLDLLGMWMKFVRFRGVEPELVNLPDSLQKLMQGKGSSHYFSENDAQQEK